MSAPRPYSRSRSALEAWHLLVAFALSATVCINLGAQGTATPQETDSADTAFEITSLAVYPPAVSLETAVDTQRIVVIGTDANGVAHDVTAETSIVIADDAVVTIVGARLLPGAEGQTSITVTYAEHTATISVSVQRSQDRPPVSYRLDVMPIFTAAGCSTGACHGSARGQDGFRLSLFGFDPDGDYHRITREIPGRRVNLAFPDTSLLLEKPTAAVPHTGGKRFEIESDFYQAIHQWISAGAPSDAADLGHVTGIELMPAEGVLAGADQSLQLVVRATYSDGTDRDVTSLAVFRTSNDTSAKVAPGGTLTTGAPGEAFITASYQTFAVGSPFIVLGANNAFTYVDPAEAAAAPANYIEEMVAAKLTKLRMNPSELCSDEVFLRRAYLDLIGLLPSPEERAAFLADTSPDKRAVLIDRLLGRKEFAELWVMQWAELLQIRSNNEISPKAALLYFEWLRSCIEQNVPIDEMVRRILTATGGTFASPPTNFYLNQPDTLVLSENVAQAFMGIRLQCAQCHNHPFDRWTQDDYYGFAAFFSQLGRKRAEDPRETIVFNRGRGEVAHPVGGRVMAPKFLGGDAPDTRGTDRREVVSQWVTSPENPYFARSFANRVWAHFMGVGIVEPIDDSRVSNPPSNAPLLDALAAKLVEYDYDLKRLVRDICTSRAYQRSTARNASNRADERNFAHGLVRRIRAEILSDIICQVTEQPEKFAGLPLGARAVQIADGTNSNYFLTTFGRAARNTVCTCEVSREPSLSQALHLLNGATVNRKIEQGNVVDRLLETEDAPEDVLRTLYLRCLCREPTEEELAALRGQLASTEDPKPVVEDVFWALLNSREFVFNH